MKINNKGFTLVELLATMAVLAVLMLITIPNVIGVVQKNKNKTFVEDAKKLISLAKYKRTKDNSSGSVTYTLAQLDEAGEIVEGPNGGKYISTSKVEINGDTYKVFLIEDKKGVCRGIYGVEEDRLFSDSASTYVKDGECNP